MFHLLQIDGVKYYPVAVTAPIEGERMDAYFREQGLLAFCDWSRDYTHVYATDDSVERVVQ